MAKILTLLFMQVTFFTMFAKEIDSLPTTPTPDSHSPPRPPFHQPINPLSAAYKANTYRKPHLHHSSISVPIQSLSSTPTHSPTLDRLNYKYECNSSHHSCPVKPPLPSHHGPAPNHRATNSLSSSYKVDEYHNHKNHHRHSTTTSPTPSPSPYTPHKDPPMLDRPNYKYECNSSHHSCPVKPPLPSHLGPTPHHRATSTLSSGYKVDQDHNNNKHYHPSTTSPASFPSPYTPPTNPPILDRPSYKYECNSSHHSCPVKPPLPSHHDLNPRHRATKSLSYGYKMDLDHNNHKHHHNHHHSSTASPAPSPSPSTPSTNPSILDRPNYKYNCNSSHHSCPVKPPLPSHHGLTPHHRRAKSLYSGYKMDQDHNNHKHHHNYHHSSTVTPTLSPSTPPSNPLILDRPNYKYECNSSHHSCPVKPPLPSHRGTASNHLVTYSLSHGYKVDLDHNNHIHHQPHSSSTSSAPTPSPSTPHTNNE